MTIPSNPTGRYVNPYTDFGFKWLFGTEMNKELLIAFLNSLLKLKSPIADINYKNVEKLGDTVLNRRAVFDVYCTSQDGEHFIVEMQREIQEFFIDRSVFYSSFPIRDQALRGEQWDFKLKAVYMVALLDFTFDKTPQYKHEVKLSDISTKEVFYDKLTFVYIELPKFKKNISQCHTLLDKWMFVLKNMTRLLDRPVELQQKIFKKLFATAEVANFNEVQRFQYEESLKEYRDWNNVLTTKEKLSLEEGKKQGLEEGKKQGMEEGKKQGLEEGKKQGLEEGKKQGLEEGKKEIARNMKQSGMDSKQIAAFTGLTTDEIENL